MRTNRIIVVLIAACLFMGAVPASVLYAEEDVPGEYSEESDVVKTDLSEELFTVSLSQESYIYSNAECTPVIEAFYDGQQLAEEDYRVEYPEDRINVGEKNLTVFGLNQYEGLQCKASYWIKVLSAEPEEVKVLLSQEDFIYDGTAKIPEILEVAVVKENEEEEETDKEEDSGKIILSPQDYNATFPENPVEPFENYEILVELTGNASCKELIAVTYCISKIPISVAQEEAVLERITYTYNGSACEPGVVLRVGDQILEENQDYVVQYQNNVNAGSGKVKIIGRGYYEGSFKISFIIRKAKHPLNVTILKKTTTVKYKKLKKKKQVLSLKKLLKISNPIGPVIYKVSSSKYLSYNPQTGKIYVAAKAPKKTYSITFRIESDGDTNHLKTYRLVKLKIKVK